MIIENFFMFIDTLFDFSSETFIFHRYENCKITGLTF